MTITTASADALEALALAISSLTAPDSATDAQYYALIAPVMLAIESRTMAPGFQYTLNVTNSLQGRPKHWYMGLNEFNTTNPGVSSRRPAQCGLQLVPDAPAGTAMWVNSYGSTIGLATCAAICLAWARIIRMWLAGNYPLAVNQPSA